MNVNLCVEIAGIKFQNPIMTASGCFGFGEEYHGKLALPSGEVFDNNRLGAVVTKTLTLEPRLGHPPTRTVETPCGMLNAIGLANPGLKGFLKGKLPFLQKLLTKIIVNIGGTTKREFEILTKELSQISCVAALEVNISCPNLDTKEKVFFCNDPNEVFTVTETVRKSTHLPIIVKLSPNVTDIKIIAKAAEDAGADAVSLINTLRGMRVNWNTGKPILSNVTGGLSGPAIMPVALQMVYEVYKTVRIPIIGIGGISKVTDVVEFMNCGAHAVQIGTAVFTDPGCLMRLPNELQAFCEERGIDDVNCLVGKTHKNT